MFCKSCGKELADSTEVCPFCQTPTKKNGQSIPVIPAQAPSPSYTEKSNGKTGIIITAVVSFVILALTVGIVLTKGFGLFDKESASEHTDAEHTTECSEATEHKEIVPPQNGDGIPVQPI